MGKDGRVLTGEAEGHKIQKCGKGNRCRGKGTSKAQKIYIFFFIKTDECRRVNLVLKGKTS